MTTIRDLFGLTDVSTMLLNQKKYQILPDYKCANPDLLVGIECEIENWPTTEEYKHFGFTFETDGSLRNNGYEAITAPTYSKHVPYILSTLFARYKITQENNYSQRCSTHVHVNCQNLTVAQVKMLCLLYQVLERPLFGFIGHDRQDNIFCVPWSQCNMSHDFATKFMKDPAHTARYWQKYTALNILPLRDRGTVEFRHLEGTCDIKRINDWLNIIGSMVKYACNYSYEDFRNTILEMNSVSNYGAFIEQVLGEFSYLLTDLPTYQQDISLGVVDCKLCLMTEVAEIGKSNRAQVRTTREVEEAVFEDLTWIDEPQLVPPRLATINPVYTQTVEYNQEEIPRILADIQRQRAQPLPF